MLGVDARRREEHAGGADPSGAGEGGDGSGGVGVGAAGREERVHDVVAVGDDEVGGGG